MMVKYGWWWWMMISLTGAFYAGNVREWSIITSNHHPSKPQQPIQSLPSTSKEFISNKYQQYDIWVWKWGLTKATNRPQWLTGMMTSTTGVSLQFSDGYAYLFQFLILSSPRNRWQILGWNRWNIFFLVWNPENIWKYLVSKETPFISLICWLTSWANKLGPVLGGLGGELDPMISSYWKSWWESAWWWLEHVLFMFCSLILTDFPETVGNGMSSSQLANWFSYVSKG